jgi:hypothetical protein
VEWAVWEEPAVLVLVVVAEDRSLLAFSFSLHSVGVWIQRSYLEHLENYSREI